MYRQVIAKLLQFTPCPSLLFVVTSPISVRVSATKGDASIEVQVNQDDWWLLLFVSVVTFL
jgi:hypothetical protein